jgi:hypothetical protein
LEEFSELHEAHTKGDPVRMLLCTNKSLRSLSKALEGKGYSANKEVLENNIDNEPPRGKPRGIFSFAFV